MISVETLNKILIGIYIRVYIYIYATIMDKY